MLTSPVPDAPLHQVAGMRNPETGVGKHVQEVGVAMAEGDLQAVVGQRLNALDVSQLALEVGRGANAVAGGAAVVDQVKPEPGVLHGEGRAVVPVHVLPDGEGPLPEVRARHPL